MDFRQYLLNNNWEYLTPNENDTKQIKLFDDGNYKFEEYNNIWIIFGKWKEKIALYNKTNPQIIIRSISEWKTY